MHHQKIEWNSGSMLQSTLRASVLCAAVAALVACAPPLKLAQQQQSQQPHRASADYAGAQAQGHQLWRIDPQQSLISIIVRRSGTLARLGHDHVVASRNVNGYAMLEHEDSQSSQSLQSWGQADLAFRVDELTVDEAALRTLAGFDTQPTQEAIDGTRRNMLTRVLDAERFALVAIHARPRGAIGGADDATDSSNGKTAVELTITLHGVTRKVDVLADIDLDDSTGTLDISGALKLKQSDFGIVPFSVLGGAIAVADELELQYRIVAEPETEFDADESDAESDADASDAESELESDAESELESD